MNRIQPVILSGGSGTRLWPLSRNFYPKQFMDLGGDNLFRQTILRATSLPGNDAPVVVCNEKHRFLAAAVLQEQGCLDEGETASRSKILLEPLGRNTAPAIALAALSVYDKHNDPILLVLSSDHVIEPQESFAEAVTTAVRGAAEGKLVVFGVPPTKPETGFGYIQRGRELSQDFFEVSAFVEKPDSHEAERMLKETGFDWNSGMFVFRASAYLSELSRHAPEVHKACLAIWEKRERDLDFIRFSETLFSKCPSISVDYAVMEHTDKACMVPLKAKWNDLGSWESFYESSPKDEAGNACTGDVVQLESSNCYLYAGHRLLATLGLEDLCVVETADAVLVLPRERSQEVRKLQEELARRKRQEIDTHVCVYRPWGSYEVLVLGDRFQVKRLVVKPGAVLSLQLHHHRAEHWVVVRGTAKVTLGDEELMLMEEQSVNIPLAVRHRLENPGRIPLEIIEIQTGSYLGEDDIVRFEDTYGRLR